MPAHYLSGRRRPPIVLWLLLLVVTTLLVIGVISPFKQQGELALAPALARRTNARRVLSSRQRRVEDNQNSGDSGDENDEESSESEEEQEEEAAASDDAYYAEEVDDDDAYYADDDDADYQYDNAAADDNTDDDDDDGGATTYANQFWELEGEGEDVLLDMFNNPPSAWTGQNWAIFVGLVSFVVAFLLCLCLPFCCLSDSDDGSATTTRRGRVKVEHNAPHPLSYDDTYATSSYYTPTEEEGRGPNERVTSYDESYASSFFSPPSTVALSPESKNNETTKNLSRIGFAQSYEPPAAIQPPPILPNLVPTPVAGAANDNIKNMDSNASSLFSSSISAAGYEAEPIDRYETRSRKMV
jgi:hypothetical protein